MDAVENMYRVAGDDRYSDTHRQLAARAIVRAGRPEGITEHFPTVEHALAYRQQYDKRMKDLYRKTMPSLRLILNQRHNFILGGPVSKEEHIRAILEDEYPLAMLNEAIHVQYHREVTWDGCDFCSSVPGLAEHTAAAQDKIIEASK